MAIYVDTCIYLNLWKKERGGLGTPYWLSAKDFFDRMAASGTVVLYSGIVLKELKYKTPLLYQQKRDIFNDTSRFKRLLVNDDHYTQARTLESASDFALSFFDCLHIVLAREACAVLVTRDRLLLEFAKTYCSTARPEEISQ